MERERSIFDEWLTCIEELLEDSELSNNEKISIIFSRMHGEEDLIKEILAILIKKPFIADYLKKYEIADCENVELEKMGQLFIAGLQQYQEYKDRDPFRDIIA